MTSARDDIREMDLMAYADGLLDGNPVFKVAVEAYLAENPADAARVQAIMQDNHLIRQLHAAELERPIPKRFLRAVREPEQGRRRMPSAIAAGVVLTVLAAAGGWYAGQFSEDALVSRQLLQAVARHHTEDGTQMAMEGGSSGTVNGTLLSAPSRNVWIEIPLPDLSIHGFELAERRRLKVEDKEMVRLVYRSVDTTLNLFMRLRQHSKTRPPRRSEADGLVVHHWSSGPVAYATTVDTADGEAAALAEMVHRAVKDGYFIDQPPAAVAEGDSVAGEGMLTPGTQQSPTPPPIQPNKFN